VSHPAPSLSITLTQIQQQKEREGGWELSSTQKKQEERQGNGMKFDLHPHLTLISVEYISADTVKSWTLKNPEIKHNLCEPN